MSINKIEGNKVLSTHQIFKLHIQVLADGELRVGYGLVKVCVQIVEHLHNRMPLTGNVLTSPTQQRFTIRARQTHQSQSILTGLMVFSSWIPYFSMLRWASANFTNASLAAACGSRTPMTEKTSPNAGRTDCSFTHQIQQTLRLIFMMMYLMSFYLW